MINRYFTHPPKQYKPFPGDSQAHKVYYMERYIVGWAVDSSTKLGTLQDIAKHSARKYKVRVPKVEIVHEKGPFGWHLDGVITLNEGWHGNNMAVFIHELAHHIHDEKALGGEAHGPEWMNIYIDLLDRYRLFPRECMELLCTKYDVDFHTCEED